MRCNTCIFIVKNLFFLIFEIGRSLLTFSVNWDEKIYRGIIEQLNKCKGLLYFKLSPDFTVLLTELIVCLHTTGENLTFVSTP